MSDDDRALILRAQGGDVEAFSKLVESRWVRLVRFSRSIVGSSDAEDLVQNGLVKAWEKLAGLRDPGAFSNWVLRIVSRECFSHIRRHRRLISIESAPPPSDPANAGIESVDVEQVLSRLPARQRAVMHLTVIEGMTDSEIGGALHITPASVRSHRRRARETLDHLLKPAAPRGGEGYEIAGR